MPGPQKQPSRIRAAWNTSTFGGGTGKQWTLITSWALVGVLIVLAAVALWPTGTPGQEPRATSSTTGDEAPSADDGGGHPDEHGGCPVGATSDARPTAAPSDIEWEAAYGSTWPVSASVGPTATVDGVARCFEHSPMGAALAAVNILEGVRVLGLEEATAVIDAQFADTPGKQVVRDGIAQASPDNPPEQRVGPRLLGFKIVSYTPDEARIVCVEAWPNAPQYTGETITVVWVDGDWRMQVEDDGKITAYGTVTVDPGSYLPWAF